MNKILPVFKQRFGRGLDPCGSLLQKGTQSEHRAKMSATGGKPAPEKVEIVWDEKNNSFRTNDGKAYLSYVLKPRTSSGKDSRDVIDLQHTFVPSSFRGQGIAGLLCVAAFEHAKEKGLLVQPTCSYVSDTFLPRNSQWNDLVFSDGTRSGL